MSFPNDENPAIEQKDQKVAYDAGDLHVVKETFRKRFIEDNEREKIKDIEIKKEEKIKEDEINAFANISIDAESLRLLKIAKEKRPSTRFAVLAIPERKTEGGKTIFHLVFQPTLPTSATKEEMEEMEKIFGAGNVPQAEPTLTGLVHQKAGEIRRNIAHLNKMSRCDLCLMSELKNQDNPDTNVLYIDPSNGNYVTRDQKGNIYRGNLLDAATGDPDIDLLLLTPDNLSNPDLRKKILDVTSRRKHTLPSLPYDCSHDFMLQKELSSRMKGGLGLSLRMKKTMKSINLEWIGRSTMQYEVFKTNPLAYRCFLFEKYNMESDGTFRGRKYTSAFYIERSIQYDIMNSIMQAATDIIGKEIDPDLAFNIDSSLEQSDNCKLYTENWNVIRHNKEVIAEKLLNTIYVITGLAPDEKQGEFWIDESDHEIVAKTLRIAAEQGITLDLNKIPDKFKYDPEARPPLFLAIKMKKENIIINLIENGATPSEQIIQYAEEQKALHIKALEALENIIESGQSEEIVKQAKENKAYIIKEQKTLENIIKYLTQCLSLQTALKEDNIALFNSCLKESNANIIDINMPIYDFYTPLDKAVELNRYEMVFKLIQHKVDINTPFPRTKKTALAHANSLEMQCLLLENGASSNSLSPDDPSYYVAELWKKMPEHKKENSYDPMKDNERLMQLLVIAMDIEKSKNLIKPAFVEEIIKCMRKNTEQPLFIMPNFKETQGETILTYAIKKGVSAEILEELIKADPLLVNKINEEKESPLLIAQRTEQFNTISILSQKRKQHSSLSSLFSTYAKKISDLKPGELKEKIVSSVRIGEFKVVLSGPHNDLYELNAIRKENSKNIKISLKGLSASAILNFAKLPDDISIINALYNHTPSSSFSRKLLCNHIFKQLLETDPTHIDTYKKNHGETALMHAVKSNQLAMVDFLLTNHITRNALLNEKNQFGENELKEAITLGNMDIIALLIKHNRLLGHDIREMLSKTSDFTKLLLMGVQYEAGSSGNEATDDIIKYSNIFKFMNKCYEEENNRLLVTLFTIKNEEKEKNITIGNLNIRLVKSDEKTYCFNASKDDKQPLTNDIYISQDLIEKLASAKNNQEVLSILRKPPFPPRIRIIISEFIKELPREVQITKLAQDDVFFKPAKNQNAAKVVSTPTTLPNLKRNS